MKSIVIATAFLGSLSATALAQESAADEIWAPASLSRMIAASASEPEPEAGALPLEADEFGSFSLGPAGGYLRVRDADRGTWFGGLQARLHLAKIFAAEASFTVHQNRYNGGDVVVTQYPLQLTAFLYIPLGPIQPYILGGVGWYYTDFDYSGAAAALNSDRTEQIFGWHLGAGVELMLSKSTSIDVDVRYIFLNPSTDNVIHQDFNYWQITFGLNFFF